jgi:hypothetical protein
MRLVAVSVLLSLSTLAFAQQEKPMTLKAVLLEQLRSTHNKAEWFVPGNTAVAGLTPAQASWTDKSGNHSVGQLANHLVFWDRESLARFKVTMMKPSITSMRRAGMRLSSSSMR